MSQPTTPPPFVGATDTKKTIEKTSTGQPAAPKPAKDYINNPFRVALTGLQQLFAFAQAVAIIALVLSVLGNVISSASGMINSTSSTSSSATEAEVTESLSSALNSIDATQVGAIVGIFLFIGLIVFIIGAVLNAYMDAASAAVAQQQKRSFGAISKQVFDRFGGYLWLTIVRAVKIFAWSLLFIIPGVIMSIRYSLAGTAFFARNAKAVESINYSTKITKGAWMTTFASYGFFNLVTLGFLSAVIGAGAQGVLYRQYASCDQNGQTKPSADVWSVVFTVLTAIIGALAVAGLGLLVVFLIAGIAS